MDHKQLWKQINTNNIKQHYYGVPSNIRSYARFIKQQLGTGKLSSLPSGIANSFDVIYEADIKLYQPVSNTAFFHDKFKDMYIFFDITDQSSPKAMLAIRGIEIEQMDDFDKFLRAVKRNKWRI